MDLTYVDVLYSIMHPIGKFPDGSTFNQEAMYNIVKLVFDKTKAEHSKSMSAAKKRAAPRIVLRVKVIEAKDLKAKDVTGTSDPYCVLGVHNEPDSKSKKKTAREIIPAAKQSKTHLKQKELNPVWNEWFQFEIKNQKKDCFLLDIWDSDPQQDFADAVLNIGQSSDMEGLQRSVKDLKKTLKNEEETHDFLGQMSYSVKSIPSAGERAWYTLEGRSSKSDVTGMVKINFRLSVIAAKIPIEIGSILEIPEDGSCQERMCRNIEVISAFINYTLTNDYQSENEKWIGAMTNELITVVHLHALHNNLSEFQEDASWWGAFAEQHHKKNMCYSAMLFYLERLEASWNQTGRTNLQDGEVMVLQKSLDTFIEDSLQNIHSFREIAKDGPDFNNLLKCLEILNKFDLMDICYPVNNFSQRITTEIVNGTKDWYRDTRQEVAPLTEKPKDVIQSLLNLTLNINSDLVKGDCYYKSKFQMIDIDYEPLIYPLIEKNLVNDITNVLNAVGGGDRLVFREIIQFRKSWENDEELWTTYFKLYIALKEISSSLEKLPLSFRYSPNLSQYHEWFRFQLERWMVMSHEKSIAVIRKAIAVDDAAKLNDLIFFSSSAVDVGVCLNELSELVSQLAWPNGCEWYAIGTLVLAMISDGATLYANLIYDKLQAVKFFDDIGQFDVSDQLYRIINSIEQVRLSLEPQFRKLESLRPLPDSLHDIDDAERISFLSDARDRMFRESNAAILRIIQVILKSVAEQMRSDLKEKMDAISSVHLQQESKESIFETLNVYLENNLNTLHTNLMVNNFDRFLLALWNILLNIFSEVALKVSIFCISYSAIHKYLNK